MLKSVARSFWNQWCLGIYDCVDNRIFWASLSYFLSWFNAENRMTNKDLVYFVICFAASVVLDVMWKSC